MTLRAQFVGFVAATTVLAVGLSAGGLWVMEARFLERSSQDRLRLMEDSLERAVSDGLLAGDTVSMVSTLRFLRRQWPSLVWVGVGWLEGGRPREVVVGEPSPGARVRPRAFPHPREGGGLVRVEAGIDEGLIRGDLDAARARLGRETALVLAVLLGVGGLLSAAWTWRLAGPLRLLSEGAEAIGQGRLGVRLEHSSRDELGQLVSAFNRMSERLQELDQMKKDFVSSVTHELRSPLAAVESILNVLLARPGGATREREYLVRARTNLIRLGDFIDNLLDAARIERGSLDFRPRRVDLVRAVAEVEALFEARAQERGVRLASRVQAGEVRADPEALRRVLVNLVSNALKFTPAGGRVSIEASAGGPGWLELSVSDDGPGLDPEDQSRLFQKFSRGRGAAGKPGTGLGLYLVRQIVEAHGGKVTAASEPGRGARFTLTLPAPGSEDR